MSDNAFLSEMETRFKAAMTALSPDYPEGRYLCAFSGGVDSTSLLALLAASAPLERLMAAHLDHGLRPESSAEAQKAALVSKSLGVPCLIEAKNVAALAKERGKGLEEAGRSARYDFLHRALDDWEGDLILTAHQAEDQAETIILKLARGCGPGALAGIPALSGRVARPLLSFTRGDLARYIAERGLSHTEDQSNQDRRFPRNLVRRSVLPLLAELNPGYLSAISRAAELAAGEEDFWRGRLDQLEEALVTGDGNGGFLLEAAAMGGLTLAELRRLAGRVLRKVNPPGRAGGEPISRRTIEDLLMVLGRPGSGGLDLPGGRRAEWRGRFLRVGPASRLRGPAGS
jgi:tRNA(Ile)-lysidine synthase